MKVSSKIRSGFSILMLLATIVVAYELSVIHQMQSVTRDLSELDMNVATTTLRLEKLADNVDEYSKKYFALYDPQEPDPTYEQGIPSLRMEFLDNLAKLKKGARTPNVKAAADRLQEAFDNYWKIFNDLKQQN